MKQNTLLLRLLTAAIVMLAAAPAWGQSAYNPEIAYTQTSGKTTSLYLANRDGSRAVRVFATPDGITGVDFAPGGNRIAFTNPKGLNVLSYSASDTGITVGPVIPLVVGIVGGPDFSPDGSRILFHQISSQVPSRYRAVNASGGTPVTLYEVSSITSARWLRSDTLRNAFAFVKPITGPNVAAVYEIWTVLLDANDQVEAAGPVLSTSTQAFKVIEDFDIAHTRDALLLSVSYPVGHPNPNDIVEFDLVSGLVTDRVGAGYRAHYSADDSRIIYRTKTYLGATDYVQSLDLGTGAVTRIFTSRKGLGTTDARP